MELKKEFEKLVYSLNELHSVITLYIKNSFQSLNSFIQEKTHIYIRSDYHNTEQILLGFYKIGLENCQKEYNYYNSILKFKEQFEIDFQLMFQIRNVWLNNQSCNFFNTEPKIILEKDIKFYIDKYKFYNSFKINLS